MNVKVKEAKPYVCVGYKRTGRIVMAFTKRQTCSLLSKTSTKTKGLCL